MVLERGRGHAAREIGDASQFRQTQDSLRGMIAHGHPVLIGKLARFVQDLHRNGGFAHVVEQRCKAEVGQFSFGIAGAIGQRNGQEGDIDRMIMGVLIMAAKSGKTENRRFVVHHEIDDVLDRPLRLFEADRSPLTD